MEVLSVLARRRVLSGVFVLCGLVVLFSAHGCGGSSETTQTLTPEAKKSLDTAKMPTNPYVKTKGSSPSTKAH
jgi:hypothetical protein